MMPRATNLSRSLQPRTDRPPRERLRLQAQLWDLTSIPTSCSSFGWRFQTEENISG